MPFLSQPVLLGKLRAGLPATTKYLSASDETRPALAHIRSLGYARIYLWTLTNIESRTGARQPDEFKIQLILPGQRDGGRGSLDLTGAYTTALLGYSPDYGVFVAWEASLHATFGYSSTVQVREALLQYANGFGWAVGSPRRVGRGIEVSVAFTPGNLLHYLKLERESQLRVLSGVEREAFLLSRTPNISAKLIPTDAIDMEDYVKSQRQSLLVSRLSRDPSFGSRVKQEYGHACAICGVQMEIVEGAHIIPITEENSKDEVWNGIALCPNHHKLFDSYAFVITSKFKLQVSHATLQFFRESGRDQGVDRYLLEFENKPVQKPRFYGTSVTDRRKHVDALGRHERHAAI